MEKDNFCGTVTNGFGKAKDFIKLYTKQFQDSLNITPYPGTVNIDVQILPFFSPDKSILVQKDGFADVLVYPAKINNQYKVWILRPLKTSHPDNNGEIMAEDKLPITIGDELICELE